MLFSVFFITRISYFISSYYLFNLFCLIIVIIFLGIFVRFSRFSYFKLLCRFGNYFVCFLLFLQLPFLLMNGQKEGDRQTKGSELLVFEL